MKNTLIAECQQERLKDVAIVFCDMDGTWLGPEHGPTAGSEAAIAEAEAAGLTFCFATGRCPLSATGASKRDISSRPGIYSNGAIVLGTGGALLHKENIPPEALLNVVDIAERTEGVVVLSVDGDEFYTKDLSVPMALHLYEDYQDPYPKETDPKKHPAQLVHMIGQKAVLDELEPRVRSAAAQGLSVARNLPTDLTITSEHSNKGAACVRLYKHLQIQGGAMCIGDSGNDVSMLCGQAMAVVGVAMANAKDSAIGAAEFSTAASNEDDVCGVLEAVRAVVAAKSQ